MRLGRFTVFTYNPYYRCCECISISILARLSVTMRIRSSQPATNYEIKLTSAGVVAPYSDRVGTCFYPVRVRERDKWHESAI